MPYKPKFERLFKLWREHDLANYRPDFYRNLQPKDELLVWEFIEQTYLLRYRSLVKLEFDWSSTGLWDLPFPGSVSLGGYLTPEGLAIPSSLASAISWWHQSCDDNAQPWNADDSFDYKTFDERGLELAKRLKCHLGEEVYVEYHPFRELKIQEGGAIETEVPEFIRRLGAGAAEGGA